MNEREKYRARIEAQLMKFGKSLYEITTKKEQRTDNLPDLKIKPILHKQQAAEAKFEELTAAKESSWQKHKAELDQLSEGIDQDLREAMTYFG